MKKEAPAHSIIDDSTRSPAVQRLLALLPYLAAGMAFGFVAVKSEIVSWYRIQEMFRFDSFHMYGVIGSAVLVAGLSVWLLKSFNIRTPAGEAVSYAAKQPTWPRYILGGSTFGLGWAIVGACPGPIYALIGAGFPAFFVVLLGAIGGTLLYAELRDRLPH